MSTVVQLGPLSLNGSVLVFIAGYILANITIRLVSGRLSFDIPFIRQSLDNAIVVGLVAGRLIFGLQYWQAYADRPWEILYFWQAGFNPLGGAIVAVGYLVFHFRKALSLSTVSPFTLSLGLSLFLVLWTTTGIAFLDAQHNGDVVQAESFYELEGEFRDLSGNVVDLQMLKGKPAVINFWATWCGPCRREMPLLANSTEELAQQGIQLVAINLDERLETVATYLTSKELELPVWINGYESTGLLFEAVGGKVMPTTLFIGADGSIRSTHVGELSKATLQKNTRRLNE